MLSGVDLSNLNGAPYAYQGEQWYQDAQFVVAQAIPRPRPNGLTGDQLRAARDDQKYVGAYSWLWHTESWRMTPDVAADQMQRLATIPDDIALDMRVWLDVEDDQSSGWQARGLQGRKDDVMRALEAINAWSAPRGLPDAGIYTSDNYINVLFDGWMPPGVMLWKAHYGVPAGSLIGGNVVAHQYTSTPIDMDVMLESEIVTQEAPVPDIDQSWIDRKPEVIGLAGELKTVADQLKAVALRKGGPRRADVLPLADAVLSRANQILGG